MKQKKCAHCGTIHSGEENWYSCPNCNRVVCPRCSDKEMQEAKDLEKLRDGDAVIRLKTLCPSCGIEMIH